MLNLETLSTTYTGVGQKLVAEVPWMFSVLKDQQEELSGGKVIGPSW